MKADVQKPAMERSAHFAEDSLATKLASAQAPFIHFDVVACCSFGGDAIVQVTLEAIRHTLPPQGYVIDSVAVAHLRMGRTAAKHLRDALSTLLDLAEPAPAGSTPN